MMEKWDKTKLKTKILKTHRSIFTHKYILTHSPRNHQYYIYSLEADYFFFGYFSFFGTYLPQDPTKVFFGDFH